MIRGSVVIPTYHRPELLERVLEARARQDLPPDEFEVIVCDDAGSDEATRRFLSNLESIVDQERLSIEEVIAEGSRRARVEAEETIRLARDAMGINYFASERPDMAGARRA